MSKIKKLVKSFEAHQDLVFLSSDLRDVLAVFNDLIRPLNNDDILNVIDIVEIVNIIIGDVF